MARMTKVERFLVSHTLRMHICTFDEGLGTYFQVEIYRPDSSMSVGNGEAPRLVHAQAAAIREYYRNYPLAKQEEPPFIPTR